MSVAIKGLNWKKRKEIKDCIAASNKKVPVYAI